MLKTLGYADCSIGVLLVAWGAWAAATQDSTLKSVLLAGVATAILGMVLRWFGWWRGRADKRLIDPSTE